MTQETQSLKIEYMYDSNESESDHEGRSFTFLLQVLKEKLDSMSSVLKEYINTNRLQDREQNNELLLYLFLQSMEKEEQELFLSKLNNQELFLSKLNNYDIGDVETSINSISSSTLPEPEIYKGWGFKFKQEGIEVKEEEDGKNYLVITIDEVFDGSQLKEMGLEKGDKIKIELDTTLAKSLSADGKFDVGKVSQFVRSAETITAITKEDVEPQLKDKMVFVKVGDKHINFEDLIDQEEKKEGDKKKLEEAVKKAFENAKKNFDGLSPATAPKQPEGKDFGVVREI